MFTTPRPPHIRTPVLMAATGIMESGPPSDPPAPERTGFLTWAGSRFPEKPAMRRQPASPCSNRGSAAGGWRGSGGRNSLMNDLPRLNEHSKFVMVSGVARSGTTLIAECLNQHPRMICAPDPLAEFFRGEILERISGRGGYFCPEIREPVKSCASRSFDGLFLEIMNLLYRGSEKNGCVYAGFKDAWCEQLFLPMSRTFPGMKFIHILRDPRSVVSSNFMSDSPYPLLFNIRDWRKSVYYSWKYQTAESELKGRVITVRYEALVSQPAEILKNVADFLGVPYEESMVHGKFKAPNTSYQEKGGVAGPAKPGGISGEFREKWKQYLSEELRIQIEKFCLPEMIALGYGDIHPRTVETGDVGLLFQHDISYDRLGPWCRQIVGGRFFYSTPWRLYHRTIELRRLKLYRKGTAPSDEAARFFHEPEYFNWLVAAGG